MIEIVMLKLKTYPGNMKFRYTTILHQKLIDSYFSLYLLHQYYIMVVFLLSQLKNDKISCD
jgi:hypothetical protein